MNGLPRIVVSKVIGALLALALTACGAPPGGRHSANEPAANGSEDGSRAGDDDSDADDPAMAGGRWAPRASLARVEDVPRAGLVEERPSRTGAVRVVALLPIDGTGNHLIELMGLPALAEDQVVASIRAAHDAPRWAGCTEVLLVGDGVPYAVDAATHETGVTPLGVMEAIQGRIPIDRLEAAAAAQTLELKSCEEEWELPHGPELLRDFVQRFQALVPEQREDEPETDSPQSPSQSDSQSPSESAPLP